MKDTLELKNDWRPICNLELDREVLILTRDNKIRVGIKKRDSVGEWWICNPDDIDGPAYSAKAWIPMPKK